MRIKVKQTIVTPDNALDPTSVRYTAENSLGNGVASLGADIYKQSTDLKISAQDDRAISNIQQALKQRGMDAQITSGAENTMAKTLTVKNTDREKSIIAVATALAGIGGKEGNISTDVANQIVEQELALMNKQPSEMGLLTLKTTPTARAHFNNKPVQPYIDADITYPLSPVAYLREDSLPSNTGSESITRMGIRNANAAIEILQVLGNDGINSSFIEQEYGGKDGFMVVKAPILRVANALKNKGMMLPAFVEEIGEAVAKARTSVTESNTLSHGQRTVVPRP